jgi:hypothetical protein
MYTICTTINMEIQVMDISPTDLGHNAFQMTYTEDFEE